MTTAYRQISPPHRALSILEPVRAAVEFASLFQAYPWLRRAPSGDNHPVLVLPGFTASDDSTVILRRFLNAQSFTAMPWRLGRNLGPRDTNTEGGISLSEALQGRLLQIFERAGERKVSLVGWSLGGVYARLLARTHPQQVRQVITLGSPFGGSPRATAVARLFESISGRSISEVESRQSMALTAAPPPGVPSTSIYSRTDGVVAWPISREQPSELSDNIEVYGSHIGLGVNPAVLYAIADRLSQGENEWQKFKRDGWRRLVYGPAYPPASEKGWS